MLGGVLKKNTYTLFPSLPFPSLPSQPTASYMPRPGADLYQFVYVDAGGEVCGISGHFLFSTPGALDELVTLENDKPEEEGAGEGLMMVVPKAQILQVRTCSSAVIKGTRI